jgi:hypothetical protein
MELLKRIEELKREILNNPSDSFDIILNNSDDGILNIIDTLEINTEYSCDLYLTVLEYLSINEFSIANSIEFLSILKPHS